MVTRWGMSERLGMVQLAPRENPYPRQRLDGFRRHAARSARRRRAAIDDEVHRIIAESHAEAQRLLTEHRRELDALAEALLARETLDESEMLAATGLTRAPAPDGRQLPARS